MKIVAEPIDIYLLQMRDGKPMPRKFRVGEEDFSETVIVKKIISVEETQRGGKTAFIYRCQSEFHGIEKQYELRYKVVESKWDLYKI